MSDELVTAAVDYVSTLFADRSDGHGVDHTMRVYKNAMRIAENESCDRQMVALAALLHDADDYKLFNTPNYANARSFLSEHGVPPDRMEAIISNIRAVSFSQNKARRPATIEGQIVQDADRLDAIGAIGIARTFAYGGRHGRGLTDSIAHFHEKLLLLKDLMNTETARALAEERHRYMETFLRQLEMELEME